MSRGFDTSLRARKRRRRVAALLLLALVIYGVSAAAARGVFDRTPPRLSVKVPLRVAAGERVRLKVGSSELVTFALHYAGQTRPAKSNALRFNFRPHAGENILILTATDKGGNITRITVRVTGVAPLKPRLSMARSLLAGDPFAAEIRFLPAAGQPKAEVLSATLAAKGLALVAYEGGYLALDATALDAKMHSEALVLTVQDEFGRSVTLKRPILIRADPRPVEVLELSGEVLSNVTPANEALEERTLNQVFANPELQVLWRQPFRLPVDVGETSSSFGDPRQYGVGGNVSRHKGADIAAAEGEPIYATNDGVVKVAGTFPIKGGLTVIDHGAGVTSLYFHQSAQNVHAGERVKRGQKIGEVGTTGLSTGPHLHWEMRVGGMPTNPLFWVGKVLPIP